jgi:cytochrome c biogenesis protein CcmG/thiol:disulfide interchange protein DsbE
MSANKKENQSKIQQIFSNQKYRNWIYTSGVIAIILVFFIVNNTNGTPDEGPYPPNYKSNSAEMLNFEEYRGNIVIIDFWATWCPPCRRGIPDLVELKNEYKDEGLEIIGISLDGITRGGQTRNEVGPFMKEYNINYPVVRGDKQVVQSYGGIRSIPTSFVIDEEGKVVSRYQGLVPKSTYVKDIKKILNDNYSNSDAVQAPNFNLPEVQPE